MKQTNCLLLKFLTRKNTVLRIGVFFFCLLSIGSIQAQELYYYSGGKKIPLKEDRTSAIIQFKENTDVKGTISRAKSSQSLKEVKAHPTRRRAILHFENNLKSTPTQLGRDYFTSTEQIESICYAYQLEGGMQMWPTNQVLLKLKQGASISSLQALMTRYQANYLSTNHKMVILKIANAQNALLLSNLIYESGLVEWATPDFFAEIIHYDTPDLFTNEDNFNNDPLLPEQFQMNNTGQTIDGFPGLNDADCNALEAWNITKGSSDIIVAVIDDGVEEHEDLGNVLPGYTPARPNENGRPKNNDAHGQACAGIIAALHNNIGVAGVAPNVKILPINIFTREESSADLANAFYWAADNGAHIISNSWGYSSCTFLDPAIDAAIQYAVTQGRGGKGSIVVFSSGNDYQTCVNYPASNPNVIAVGAFANTGVISAYSNQGTALDIVAPSNDVSSSNFLVGAGVRTIDRMGAAGYGAGNYTNSFGGTSAACPVVSGVAALILSVNPDLTDAEVKDILYTSALDMGTPGRDNTFGHGRVNALAAVNEATASINNTPPVALINADPVSGTFPLTVNFDASGSIDADNDVLTYTWNFGDGNVASGLTVSHTYTTPGLYDAMLIVSDGIRLSNNVVKINVKCSDNVISVNLELQLDDYPSETSWQLKDANGNIVADGGGYTIPRSLIKERFCLPEGCYDFVIVDSFRDGICCSYGNGSYKITQGEKVLVSSNGQFGAGETKNFCPDVEKPVITGCPSNIVLSNATGLCSAVATWTAPTASDNSGSANLTNNIESGTSFSVGETTVTYTATDAAGNTATCSFTVTVNDTEVPVITCPSNISETVAFGETGKVITYDAPTFSDNCAGAGIQRTAGLASGATFPVGTTTITYQVSDAAGNTAECSFTVSITENADDTDPVLSNCPENIVLNNVTGLCSAVATWTAPTASDNSGSANLTSNIESGASFPIGVTTVTYMATDAAGNTATCSFTVTVNDTEVPLINCPANISETVAFGETGKVITYDAPTFSDNCAGAGIQRTAGNASGAVFPLGTTTVTYLATDAAGNTAECSFTVTITENADNTNPVLSNCSANIVLSNATGLCSAVATWEAPTASDNSGSANLISNIESGTSFPFGITTVTYTATDAAGNTATCSFTVTVVDTEAPVITLNGNSTIGVEAGSSYTELGATVTDNCSQNLSAIIGGDIVNTAVVGTYIVTYKATDNLGNSATQVSRTVNVGDATPPTAPVLSVGTITQTSVVLSWTASTDNVGVTGYDVFNGANLVGSTANLNFTVNSLTANTAYSFTVKAKDAAGNSSVASNVVSATTLPNVVNPITTRINAGGTTQTVSGITWSGCTTGNCNGYVTGGFAYTQAGNPTINGVVSPLNQTIYRTEWTGGAVGGTPVPVGQVAFSYNIPVVNGTYLIRLYFAELNKNGVGLRVFDVNIEGGAKELVNYDIFKEVGYRTATSKEFTFNITDGVINIAFIRQIENAKISAIEIIPQTTDTQAPTTPVLSLGTVGQTSVTLNWTASTDNVGVTAYDVFNGANLVGTTSNLNFTVTGLNANTAYTFTVKAKDAAGNISNASNIVNATTLPPTIRINAGGTTQTVSGTTWSGCSNAGSCNGYVTGGFAYTQAGNPTINGVVSPLNQAIYQTEWTGGAVGGTPVPVGQVAFSYNIPVVNGTYLIRLYFAELNKNGVGLRVFDVNIEGGAKELVNYDIFKEVGYRTATSKEFTFNITDGAINIAFIRQIENAKISAIEIIPVAPVNQAATSSQGENAVEAKEAATLAQDISKLYPNPTSGSDAVYVEFSGEINGKVEYSISDAKGKVFAKQVINLDEPQYVIKIAIANLRLSQGVYYLYIKGDKLQEKIIRFVKN